MAEGQWSEILNMKRENVLLGWVEKEKMMHLADYIFNLHHVVCYIQKLLLNVFRE